MLTQEQKEARMSLMGSPESVAVVSAFSAITICDFDKDGTEADFREMMSVSHEVKDEALGDDSQIAKLFPILGSEVAREYTASKLRKLADLLELL